MSAKPSQRQCQADGCNAMVNVFNSLQAVYCSPACGYALSQQLLKKKSDKEKLQAKRERNAAKRAFRENDRPLQLKLTQKSFNAWIRERDYGQGCISCGTHNGKVNAGHYKSVGAHPELRFNEHNCHAQCERCNSNLSGNIGPYRAALIEKIGVDLVEWIEGPHTPKRYTCDELIQMRKRLNAQVRDMRLNRVLET